MSLQLLTNALLDYFPSTTNFQHIVKQALSNLGINPDQNFEPDLIEQLINNIITEIMDMQQFSGSCPNLFPDIDITEIASADPQRKMAAGWKLLLNNTTNQPYSAEACNSAFNFTTEDEFQWAREMIQSSLHYIYGLLCALNSDQNLEDEKLEWLLVQNRDAFLSFYTFMSPKHNDFINIPQKVQGTWEYIQFRLDLIPLAKGVNPDVARYQKGVVNAYGLTPVTPNKDYHPYLLFRGTPPTDIHQGKLTAIAADYTPNQSVGEPLIRMGYENLMTFFENASLEFGGFIVAGHSLGGSMALLASKCFAANISEVRAFCPAGLKGSTMHDAFFMQQAENPPAVNVFMNNNDIVSLDGYFDPNWQLYRIFPQQVMPFSISAIKSFHVPNFLGQSNIIICKVKPAVENQHKQRIKINNLKDKWSPTVYKGISFISSWSQNSRKNHNSCPNLNLKEHPIQGETFEEKLDQFTKKLAESGICFDDKYQHDNYVDILQNFIQSYAASISDLVCLYNAIGFGRGNNPGKNDCLSQIRIKKTHPMFNSFSPSKSYGDNKFSARMAELIQCELMNKVHIAGRGLPEVTKAGCRAVFAFPRTTRYFEMSYLEYFEKFLAGTLPSQNSSNHLENSFGFPPQYL